MLSIAAAVLKTELENNGGSLPLSALRGISRKWKISVLRGKKELIRKGLAIEHKRVLRLIN